MTTRGITMWPEHGLALIWQQDQGNSRVVKVSDRCWLCVPNEIREARVDQLIFALHRNSN